MVSRKTVQTPALDGDKSRHSITWRHTRDQKKFFYNMKAAHAAQVMKHMRPTDNAKPAAVFHNKKAPYRMS